MHKITLNASLLYFSRLANCQLDRAVRDLKGLLGYRENIPEPCYVAAIVELSPKWMQSHCTDIRFGGCFIHQKPYVAMENEGCCEVGDLLVLCRKVVDGEERFNAALFQVKKAKEPFLENQKPDRKDQLTLYTKWPRFCFGRTFDVNNKQVYDIHPKTVSPGAQYMFINDGPMYDWLFFYDGYTEYPVVFTHNIPSSEIENDKDLSFGRFLWYFVNWQIGKPIDLAEIATDEWSKLIWTLISKTHDALIPLSATPASTNRVKRNVGDFFEFMLNNKDNTPTLFDHLKDIFSKNGGDNNSNDIPSDDSGGAISTLYIDLGGDASLKENP